MKKLEERIFKFLMIGSTALILSLLLYILYIILMKGLPSLSWEMISQIPSGGFYLGKEGGILNAIMGSLYLIFFSVLISLCISVPVVMYLNFTLRRKSKLAAIARLTFDVLFGIPSIVYGAFGFTLMIYFGLQASLFGGIIAITLLIIPVMIRSIDEVAILIPNELIEATKSLGATNYETIKVVTRQLLPGISTAVLLSIGRGIGDAATVLFTAGYTDSIPSSLLQPTASLPLAIFFQLSSPIEEVQNRAYSAALVLTIIILILSFSARYFSRRLSKNKI
jgi:phosphate transport system permease protein